MFCESCGSRIPDGDSFCSNCGQRIVQQVSAPEPRPAPAPAPGPTQVPVTTQPVYQQAVYQQPGYQQPANMSAVKVQPVPVKQLVERVPNKAATVGLVFAIITLVFCWVPVLYLVTGLVGTITSIVGIAKRNGEGKAKAIVGLSLSVVGVITGFIVTNLIVVPLILVGIGTAEAKSRYEDALNDLKNQNDYYYTSDHDEYDIDVDFAKADEDFDGTFIDRIEQMDIVDSGKMHTVYNEDFNDYIEEARWWDYDATMDKPGVYSTDTEVLAFSIQVNEDAEDEIYYAYYYSEDKEFDKDDLAKPIFSDTILPTEYENGTRYYNVECDIKIKEGYYVVVIAADESLKAPYILAYAEVK